MGAVKRDILLLHAGTYDTKYGANFPLVTKRVPLLYDRDKNARGAFDFQDLVKNTIVINLYCEYW